MSDEENDPEGANLVQERNNSAWEAIIRPGLAGTVPRGSPADIGVPARLGMPAWANSGLGSDPSLLKWRPGGDAACRFWPGRAGPAGEGRAAPAQPGRRGGLPGIGLLAQPGKDHPAPPGKKSVGPPGVGGPGPAGENSGGPAGAGVEVPGWAGQAEGDAGPPGEGNPA
jgi:hypothetical protein